MLSKYFSNIFEPYFSFLLKIANAYVPMFEKGILVFDCPICKHVFVEKWVSPPGALYSPSVAMGETSRTWPHSRGKKREKNQAYKGKKTYQVLRIKALVFLSVVRWKEKMAQKCS